MTYGRLWTQEEEDAIVTGWKAAPSLDTVLKLADQIQRTPGAILSRLAKPHRLIYPYNDQWYIPAVPFASFREVARHTEAFKQRIDPPIKDQP